MSSRRQFLKDAGLLSLCSAGGISSMLTSIGTKAADYTGYRALVCVFLYGGMDNHDTILPYDLSSYERYVAIRRPLIESYGASRTRESLLPLKPGNAGQFSSRQFALPAELEPLHSLFRQGSAAIIGNVGPLLEPITRIDFVRNRDKLPARLFSHNDQRSTWMSLQPEGARSGWGGRFADVQIAANANEHPAFSSISLYGNSVFLFGKLSYPYQIAHDGAPSIHAFRLPNLNFAKRLSGPAYTLLRQHFASEGVYTKSLLEQDLARQHERSFANNELFSSSSVEAPALSTIFPSSEIGLQLLGVAHTIACREELGASRQIFFVGMGNFDTHAAQSRTLPALHVQLGQAIRSFYTAMQELGTALDVTLFTASDFGRTLAVNGDGTDHGWGGHHFVVGGSVAGGNIYGDLPPSDFEHDFDAGGGRLIPSVSLHQYAATLGRWFGLSSDELSVALPGLERFPQGDLLFV